MKRVYIFDKDGTLIAPIDRGNGKTRPANKPEEQILLPNVLLKIKQLRGEGAIITCASNQGGVAWEIISSEDARLLMKDCGDKVGGFDYYIYCPYDPKAPKQFIRQGYEVDQWYPVENIYAKDHPLRKPNPGMILFLMEETGASSNEVIFIGDQESDREAANAAAVEFMWAKDFFGWE